MVYTEKSYSDIVAEITQYILENTTEVTDFNNGSVMNTLIKSISRELSESPAVGEITGLYQALTDVYEGTKIETADGYDLDQLGALVGVVRKEGVEASGNVTFARTTPAGADFTIPAGTVVSTQPVEGEDNIRFTSTSTTIFDAEVANENHTFVDGIYNYPLDQRLLSSVTTMTGTRSSSSVTLVENTDFQISSFNDEVVDTGTIATIDDCDATTGWSSTADAASPTVDGSDYKQGSGALNIGKTGTSSTLFAIYKTTSGNVDITAKKLLFHFKHSTSLNTILDKYVVRVGSSSTDYIEWEIDPVTLSDGWQLIKLNTDNATFSGGPIFDQLDYIYFGGQTNASGDTFTLGDLKVDFFFVSETIDYEGDLIEFLIPVDDGTTFTTTYVPLSVEVNVQAEETGTEYNVGAKQIVYMVSEVTGIVNILNYSEFTNGENEESDSAYRERIRASAEVGGHSTVKAIEDDMEALDYVQSASVEDMPLKSEDNETFTFSSGTSEYQLTYEVAQNNSYRELTGYEDSLNGGIDDSQTTITLNDASNFKSAGKVIIEDEVISYTGKSTNDLTGCTRGDFGTTAVSHSDTTTVAQWYEPDTDYVIDEESKVVFQGADDPQDTEPMSIDYQYRWLGHITVFATGFTPFTTAQLTEINDKLTNEFKAAGIWYTLTTPTNIAVNVTADIHILDGFVFDTVRTNVINEVRNFLNSYQIGENARVSQLYDIIQSVSGVDYSSISTPSSDVAINDDEIASAGTIVINQY